MCIVGIAVLRLGIKDLACGRFRLDRRRDCAAAGSAVAELQRQPPPCDLAIVEISLRSGSGLDVLRTLQRASSSLHRVVLTSYAVTRLRDDCLALGAERVFEKSTDVEALAAYCDMRAARCD